MDSIQTSLLHRIAPVQETAGRLHPTLLLLHGRGSNEEDLLGLTPFLDPRFMVITVRAPFEFPFGGYTWYDIHDTGSPEPGQFQEAYDRLVQFIHDVRTQYPVDPSQFFLLGFSMGTVISYAYALTHPEEVTGVAANSGYIPEETMLRFQWDRLKGKSFFIAHGVHDPVIGIEFGRRAKELLAQTDAEVLYKEYPIPHSMSEESINDISRWLGEKIGPSSNR